MALWAKQMNMKFPSPNRFHAIQRSYVLPAVEEAWKQNQTDVVNQFQGQDIILMGDGRNDSPGHSAQYCSYTLMEYNTKKIVSMQTVDKRQTERKSVNMEKLGFIQGMADVRDKVGGRETQYPETKHSYDIWHMAKNLGKKIHKITQKKQNAVLSQWTRDIINHFWFSCQKAENYSEFLGIWRSVLSHVTNQHEWIIPHGGDLYRCLHEPLTDEDREKPWLDPVKHKGVLKELAEIVLDQRLLKKVSYFLNFRSTADLEGFNQHILMYCAKRFAYSPPVYRARNLLAALDHNVNSERGVMKNKDGTVRYHRTYNKKSGRWSVYPCREPKSYKFVERIVETGLVKRISEKTGMYRKTELQATDPRRISSRLPPLEPPPTLELVKEQVSRYK